MRQWGSTFQDSCFFMWFMWVGEKNMSKNRHQTWRCRVVFHKQLSVKVNRRRLLVLNTVRWLMPELSASRCLSERWTRLLFFLNWIDWVWMKKTSFLLLNVTWIFNVAVSLVSFFPSSCTRRTFSVFGRCSGQENGSLQVSLFELLLQSVPAQFIYWC